MMISLAGIVISQNGFLEVIMVIMCIFHVSYEIVISFI
jgi:hypothetical protein